MIITLVPAKYRKATPCKDCTNRFVNCHGLCEDYKEYKRITEEQKEKIVEKRKKDNDYNDYKIGVIEKAKKKACESKQKRLRGQL